MVGSVGDNSANKCSFESALDLTGYGKYNIGMLTACCSLIMAMYMDIFGVSVVVPAIACDLSLNTTQQGILTAVPLIGVIIASYGWGLAADTIGRRKSLLIAMPIGFILGIAASMSPNYTTLTVLKLFSVMFTSSANAAAFVLAAESVPSKNRNYYMFIMASATMSVLCIMCAGALLIFKLTFRTEISWLGIEYTPWRLLLQIVCLPGAAGVLYLLFLKESPKFLLSTHKHKEALVVLQTIFQCNTGFKKEAYSATHVYLDEIIVASGTETSVLKKIWNQTAPLFKPPLLKNSVILYYLLLCAFMTSTGYTMWVPTITNAFFTDEDRSGLTFCDVASRSARANSTSYEDCDHVIHAMTLYGVICYSGGGTILTILLSFLVNPLGKKKLTLMVFAISTLCGILLFFVKIPLLSIALFYMFLYVAQILGNVNAYLVDLNPTHLRGMATCLSIVVARGLGFISVQLIGTFLENHCTPLLGGYVLLVVSGLVIATLLPSDNKTTKDNDEESSRNEHIGSPNNEKY